MNIQYEIIECTPQNSELIQYLTKYAEVDADDYDKIFPWRHECSQGGRIYVALSMPPGKSLDTVVKSNSKISIYGWLNATITTWKNKNKKKYDIAYVAFLATRQRTERIKGLGKTLMEIMEKDMRDRGVDFIKLMPIESASSFYKMLGYTPCLTIGDKPAYLLCKTLWHHGPNDEYAQYLEDKRNEDDMATKEKKESIIKDIRSKLTEKEQEVFDQKRIEDDIFELTCISVYEDSQHEIDQVRGLLGGRKTHKKKKIKTQKLSRRGKRLIAKFTRK